MSGRVVTFYSYKGGVGRTFALANVAALLGRWGRKVLCIDWDLEAPGLDAFFGVHGASPDRPGLLEWVQAQPNEPAADWRRNVQTLK